MRLATLFACSVVLMAPCATATAQDERPDRGQRQRQRAPQMTPAQAETAWSWQAKTVALALKLDAEKSGELVKAYTAARKDMAAKLAEAREAQRGQRGRGLGNAEGGAGGDAEGGRGGRGGGAGNAEGGRGGRGGGAGNADGGRGGQGGRGGAGGFAGRGGPNQELMTAARTSMETKLTALLGAENTKKAMPALGSFNQTWDRMTHGVLGLKLDPEMTMAALLPVHDFVVTTTKLRDEMMSGEGDRSTMRARMTAAQEKLRASLGKFLTEEQMQAVNGRQRGQRGQRAAGGRGGDGAPGADAPAAPRTRGGPDAPTTTTTAKLGEAAPNFTLTSAEGKTVQLSDYAGKIVVLQWINPDCPVCRRVASAGIVANMQKAVKAIDPNVVHLTINSTNYMDAATSGEYVKTHKFGVPALIDQDGTVGRMYGARTTPHMFVIDASGVLRYEGAIDDDANGRKGKDAKNYVVNAVKMIAAGETVSPDTTSAYGCSVKYKN